MDAPDGPEHFGFDAWVLCGEFVEKILSEAQAEAIRESPQGPAPEFDRVAIWRAGDGAPSDEAAMGRIVRAAWEAARGISPGTSAYAPAPPPGPLEESGPDRSVSHEPPVAAAPVALAAAVAYPVEPAAEPVTASAAPNPVASLWPSLWPNRWEPVAVAEPMVVPVETGVAAAGSVVEPVERDLARGEPPAPAPAVWEAPATAVVTPVLAPVGAPVMPSIPEPPAPAVEAGRAPTGSGETTRKDFAWVTFFTWMRNIGAIVLLFVAWQLWGTAIAQHHAQGQLQAQFDAFVAAHHTSKSAKPTLIPASTFVPSGGDGSVVARLQIPAIGLNQYVVQGTNATDLSKGPGHYTGTAMPGQAGNVAIAGHRTTHGAPFNRLGQLVIGDKIIVTTTSGQDWTYVVSAMPVAVSPHDTAVLNYFGDNRITLTTCTPEFSATQRLIVVGALKAPQGVGSVHDEHLTYHLAASDAEGWNWGLLPAVGLEVCFLVLLGLAYRRFNTWFGPVGMWFVLVPVWAAGLVLLFTTLTTFLPSSF